MGPYHLWPVERARSRLSKCTLRRGLLLTPEIAERRGGVGAEARTLQEWRHGMQGESHGDQSTIAPIFP